MEGRHPVRVVDARARTATSPPSSATWGTIRPDADADALPRQGIQRLQVGHGDRPERLHRLQRLRRRLRGREQHPGRRQGAGRRSREMHWLRVDRYFDGQHRTSPTGTYHQPVPCQQCENAPCEVVCPVAATVAQRRRPERHGLQPLRRHAVLLEQLPVQGAALQLPALRGLDDAESSTLQRNPDVTVRSRGVMEKCTYCVQRINHARIDAKTRGPGDPRRRDRDGLPGRPARPRRSSFGDINDPNSRVAKLKAAGTRTTALLEELNTRPRTTYLAAVRNPNPALEPARRRPAVRRRRRTRWTLRQLPTARRPTRPSRSSRRDTRSESVTDKIADDRADDATRRWLVRRLRASASRCCTVLLIVDRAGCCSRASASGATTSRSAGGSTSSTSSGGSASATPAR